MKSTRTILAIVVVVAALGSVGIISAISSAMDANAASCKDEPGPPCHGCSSTSRAAFVTNFHCRHFRSP